MGGVLACITLLAALWAGFGYIEKWFGDTAAIVTALIVAALCVAALVAA